MTKRKVCASGARRLAIKQSAVIAMVVLLSAMAGCDLFVGAETRIQRAEMRIAAREYREASIELRNALQDEPSSGRARRLLAEVSLQLGDAPGAEADMRRALESGEPPASMADLAARIRLAMGQSELLLGAIDSGEYQIPEPNRSLYRGEALLQLRRHSEAQSQFEAARKQDPNSIGAMLGVSQAQAGLGQFDQALESSTAVTRQYPDQPDGWLVRGNLLAARGQYDAAIESLEKARTVDAGQLPAQQRALLLGTLIEARLSRGEVAAAETALQELVRIFPGAPVTRFMSARISIVNQDFAAATTELQRLVAASPAFTSARFLLGAVSLAQGRLQQADLHLSQVVQSAPENTEARKLLAQVRMRLDRPDEAVQVMIPALESEQMDPQVSSLLNAAQLQSGQPAQEVAALEKAVAGSPDNPSLNLNLAAAYLREGEAGKALDVLGSPAARRGGAIRDALNLAALAATRGAAAADLELNRLLRERPEDVDVLNLAAALLTQRAEFDRARGLLVNALALKPNHASSLLGMARLEAAAGNIAVAEGQLEKLLVVQPGSALAEIGLADLALRKGDRAGAIRRMEEWNRMAPNEPGALFRLMRLHLLDNQSGAAQKVVDDALATSPDPSQVLGMAGAVYLEFGRYEQASASFRKAVEASGDVPASWLGLAQAQLALDRAAGAREALGRALALRPEWVPAVGMTAMLDLRDGNQKAALDRITTLKSRRPRDAAVRMLEGDIYLLSKRYREADEAFEASFSLRPDATAALKSYRARLLGRLGQTTAPLTRWLAQNPGDFSVRAVLAEAYQLAGQTGRAIQEFETVVSDGPPNALALNNLAWLYLTQGDRRAAATALRAHSLAPDSAPITDTYAWILVQNGRAPEGLELLEPIAKQSTGNPEFQYHYAAALAKVGRSTESRQVLSTLLARHDAFDSRAEAQKLDSQLAGNR